MNNLIIGSTAIKHYFPDFNREPKDLDIVVPEESSKKEEGIEYLYNPIILKYQSEGYLHPNLMLSLKISHLFFDFNWEKHMWDVQFLLKKGCAYDANLIKELFEFWKEYLPKIRRSDLSLSKEDFFTNNVNKDENEHDFLHTLLKPRPTYLNILKDGSEVEPDENKFNNLSWEDKANIIFEESAVMAYERYPRMHFVFSYKKQLKDNIIKHFPFFVAIFAIENFPKLEKPFFNFKQQIDYGLKTNK